MTVRFRAAHMFVAIASLFIPCGRLVAASKPNFVFILTDDQRWDALGVVQAEQGEKGRFPWLKTPNLDKLAAEGIRFRNAFVVNALCSPSRASFLTGMYGHQNGIRDNQHPLAADSVTYASILRQTGYTAGYIGKWHMGKQQGQRPGFDYSASFVGQGKYRDCPFEINGKATPTSGWVDDVSTDYAVQFMRSNKERAFVLAIGYKACHGPFSPPSRRANDYAEEAPRPVPNLNASPPFPRGRGGEGKVAEWFKKQDWSKLRDYMRCVTAIDDNVGRVLAELEALGLVDSTMVVFAGDNGYYLGEHGLGDKRTAYEESIRIPLLVRYPKMVPKGRLVDQMVLNVDLAPTLLDLAGVEVPKQMHGRSWRALLEGKDASWRSAFYYEYFCEAPFASPAVQAIRTDHAKLICYPGHAEWTELFDLSCDPYELKNLGSDESKADLRKELEAELARQMKQVAVSQPSR